MLAVRQDVIIEIPMNVEVLICAMQKKRVSPA